MELFGIGGLEFLLVIIIAMVVAGPKRVVQWAYLIGKFLARVRRIWSEMMLVIQQEMKDAGMDVELPKTPPTRQSINQATRNLLKPYVKDLDDASKDLQRDLDTVSREMAIKENVKLSNQLKQNATAPKPTPEIPQNGTTAPSSEPPSTFGTWSSATEAKTESSDEPS
jgi:sec-independent protein translocase protein TatB